MLEHQTTYRLNTNSYLHYMDFVVWLYVVLVVKRQNRN